MSMNRILLNLLFFLSFFHSFFLSFHYKLDLLYKSKLIFGRLQNNNMFKLHGGLAFTKKKLCLQSWLKIGFGVEL